MRAYVNAIKTAKQHPQDAFNRGLIDYGPCRGLDIVREFFHGVQDRINLKDVKYPRGRKAQDDYQTELVRLRQFIGNRIVLDWIAPCLGSRVRQALLHRLRQR
jgi:hypothetical protein